MLLRRLEFDFVDEFAVGLEVHHADVFPFLDEEAFSLADNHLIGNFVLDHQGVKLFDFVARMVGLDLVDD